MSDSVQPHRRQPTRLPRPWDSPGKNTGVGCHFLRQCMKVKSESEIAQSCPTLSDPMDCSLPGSSIHGIFQAKVLEWGAYANTKHIRRKGNYRPVLLVYINKRILRKISSSQIQQNIKCIIHHDQVKFILECKAVQHWKICQCNLKH